jgi:hypothetical protein
VNLGTLGWAERKISPKRPCVRCLLRGRTRRVSRGMVNPKHPAGNVLCFTCFAEIMDPDVNRKVEESHGN